MVAGVTKGTPSKKSSTSTSSPRRWWNPLALVLCSFTAGAMFGASIVRFHGESVSLAISRLTLSLQEDMISSPSTDTTKKNDCQCKTEGEADTLPAQIEELNIPLICESNNYTKATLIEQRALTNDSTLKKQVTSLARIAERPEERKMPPIKQPRSSTARVFNKHPSNLVGAHGRWCPRAICKATELCRPCRRRFLILITTARSASTTLTWMLNELPGIRMSGENADTLGSLKMLMDNVLNNPHFKQSTGMRASWGHQYVPPRSLSCVSQAMIEGINPPPLKNKMYIKDVNASRTDIVGFKTIRFFQNAKNEKDERSQILWLKREFPCSRVIVNINSDTKQYVKSVQKAWQRIVNDTETEENIEKQNNQLKKVVKTLGPKNAYLLDKKEWTKNITKLNEAVQWMGFHPSCKFTELMEFHTEGGGYGNGKTSMKKFSSACKRLDDD